MSCNDKRLVAGAKRLLKQAQKLTHQYDRQDKRCNRKCYEYADVAGASLQWGLGLRSSTKLYVHEQDKNLSACAILRKHTDKARKLLKRASNS
jgi:hypothetical protein